MVLAAMSISSFEFRKISYNTEIRLTNDDDAIELEDSSLGRRSQSMTTSPLRQAYESVPRDRKSIERDLNPTSLVDNFIFICR